MRLAPLQHSQYHTRLIPESGMHWHCTLEAGLALLIIRNISQHHANNVEVFINRKPLTTHPAFNLTTPVTNIAPQTELHLPFCTTTLEWPSVVTLLWCDEAGRQDIAFMSL